MSDEVKTVRHIFLCTDDTQEAVDELKKRKAERHQAVAMAEVRTMKDPPKTKYRWVVFKIMEDHSL